MDLGSAKPNSALQDKVTVPMRVFQSSDPSEWTWNTVQTGKWNLIFNWVMHFHSFNYKMWPMKVKVWLSSLTSKWTHFILFPVIRECSHFQQTPFCQFSVDREMCLLSVITNHRKLNMCLDFETWGRCHRMNLDISGIMRGHYILLLDKNWHRLWPSWL